jgi:hypothetical protein
MFGHHERRRLGKVEDLACDIAIRGAPRQRIGAAVAAWRKVIGDMVRIGHYGEGFPGMVRLAAGRLLCRLPRAAGMGWLLLQPVTRRRLAAVGTVQPEAALQLRRTRQKRRSLAGKTRIPRNEALDMFLQRSDGWPIAHQG